MIDFSGSQPDYLILTPHPTTTFSPDDTNTSVAITETPPIIIQATHVATTMPATISISTPIVKTVSTSKPLSLLSYIGAIGMLILVIFLIVKSRKK